MATARKPRTKKTEVAAAAAPKVSAKFDAAGMGRRIKHWNPPATGPARVIEGTTKLRDRSRDSHRNDWAAESGTAKWTTSLVGVGITPRWEDDAHQLLWDTHAKVCDADCVSDAYAMQTLGTRAWLSDGEVFLRRRNRNPRTSPLPIPVQYQLIEADFCPIFDATAWPGMPTGNEIRQGVERNKYGERVAYWMFKEHPGDKYVAGSTPSQDSLIRIAASEISHVFEPDRPGQLRGVSELAPILVRLRASMDFEDIVLDRQKLANLFTMFITRQLPPEWDDIQWDPDTGLPVFYDKDMPTAPLQAGVAHELEPGEDVKFSNPPEAGTTFSEYMRTTHMGTAAGRNLPYEFLSGDIMNVSDRTLRVLVNEFRRFAEQRQWQVLIPKLCQPMVQWAGEAAVLGGKLPLSELAAFVAPEWQPHGWPDIHPTQDIDGRIKERDAGFTSTSAIIARKGDNPKKVLEQRKADEQSGLTPKPEPKPGAPAPAQQDPNVNALLAGVVAAMQRPAAAEVPPAPQIDVQALVAAVGQAFTAALAPALQAIVAQAQQQPAPITVTTPPVTVSTGETHVHVPAQAAPQVDVHVPAQPAPQVDVHVPAPTVNVTNDVQPAAVQVDVNLPPRETVSEITRDRDTGDITKVIQTERTLND